MQLVEIFSGPQCNYCEAAKALLDAKGIEYVEMRIDEPANRAEYAERLPRSKSIPQIFIDGEHIGGLEDLQLMDQRGQLEVST